MSRLIAIYYYYYYYYFKLGKGKFVLMGDFTGDRTGCFDNTGNETAEMMIFALMRIIIKKKNVKM